MKKYCHIWNQHPRIFFKAKFRSETKILKPKCIILGVLDSSFEKLLSYLTLAFSNLSYYKVWCKIKILKFGTKNAWFGYFWARTFKKLWSHLKLAPSNLSNVSFLRGLLNDTVNFDIGSTFSKVPGSNWRWRSTCEGPGPLYKVCHSYGITLLM